MRQVEVFDSFACISQYWVGSKASSNDNKNVGFFTNFGSIAGGGGGVFFKKLG